MAFIVGIDLGTWTTAISCLVNDRPEIRPDPQDAISPVTPSAVLVLDGQDPVVGKVALNQHRLHPGKVITEAKRSIGTQDLFPVHDPKLKAHEVLAEVLYYRLSALPAQAASHQESEIRAVISVPAYYGDLEKKQTREAWNIARERLHNNPANQQYRFELDGLIDEPLAAAIHQCSFSNVFTGEPLLVFDLGGGTFDVTVYNAELKPESGVLAINVFAKDGEQQLGGVDWDQVLRDWWCREAGVGFDELPIPDQIELMQDCTLAREHLSETSPVVVRGFSTDGRRFDLEVTRMEFENQSVALLERLQDCLKRVGEFLQSEYQISLSALKVLTVGGATKMPMIRQLVEDYFGPGQVHEHHSPQEAVVHGACLYGAILNGAVINNGTLRRIKEIELHDILTRSYGILGHRGDDQRFGLKVVIPRNKMCNGQEYIYEDAAVNQTGNTQLRLRFGAISDPTVVGDFIPLEENNGDYVLQMMEMQVPHGLTTVQGQPVHFILKPMANGMIEGYASLRELHDPTVELCKTPVQIKDNDR